jgi:hypothetical protein
MMSFKKVSFAVMFSAFALAQSAGAATIVPVPAPVVTTATSPEGPVSGEFQGMVTSVTQGSVSINSNVLQVTGDTVITYNGGLTSLTAGQIANYSYATDVDGVMIATTIDAYPTQAVSGTARVYGLGVNNATGGVQLYLSSGGAWATYTGPAVEYFQPYAFISGIGTNTAYGAQLVNYSGFVNPTTGRILATGGAMMDIPVTFKPTLAQATVGQAYNQYTMELGIYGAGDVYMVTATGLPAGLSMSTNGVISGTPTTAGTYTVSMTAMCGQHCVAPYTAVGQGSVTIVVASDVVVTPPVVVVPPTPVSCSATGIIMNYPVSKFWLDVSVDGLAPVKVNFATQANTTFVSPATTFENGQTVSYTGTYDATGTFCNADTMTVTPAPVVVVVPPTPTPVSCSATGIIMNYPVSKFWLDVSVDGLAPVKVNFATQANTTFVSPATTFENGQTVSYTGTYDATGTFCNADTMTVTPAPVVVVPDTTAPVITMIGTDVTLVEGTSHVDAGATCTDNVDVDCYVTTTGNVNIATAGTYTVTYSAADAAGNIATPVVRTVTVTPAPVVTPPAYVISTGKKVEATKQTITAVSSDSVTVGSTVIRITATTVVRLNKAKPLAVGTKIEYKGVVNTDGSITATVIKAQ